jgi:transcription initiation factor IIE alpha subunit
LVAVLQWVEATGTVTSGQLADAMGLTAREAGILLLRLYRRKLVRREREASLQDARSRWHYKYWVTNQGIAKIRWLRGG